MSLTISMRSLDQAQNSSLKLAKDRIVMVLINGLSLAAGLHSSNTSLPFTRFTKISQIDSEHLSAALCLRINNYRTSNTRANVSESVGSCAAACSLFTTHAKICIRYYKSRAYF